MLEIHVVITPAAGCPSSCRRSAARAALLPARMTGIDLDAIEVHIDDIVWEAAAGT